MNLFSDLFDATENLLPRDGTVNYHGPILTQNAADQVFNCLLESIAWSNDEAIIRGKRIVTKRKVAWYGDRPFAYTYSQTTKLALPWTDPLLDLKSEVERASNETFNSCLLNLYHSGEEGMSWHSDAERDLKKHGAIGSLSLGAERKFAFKHKKNKQTATLLLEHGSLLIMKGCTQTFWLHRLPPTKKVDQPRINLTFRTIVENPQELSATGF